MADIVLLHHVRGLTSGVRAMATEFESWGHMVHLPDLFDGVLPADLPAGINLVDELGEEFLTRRVEQEVSALSQSLVYIGISYGAMQAQRLAQQRPGARGAILLESFIDLDSEWSFGPWPATVPAQIHGMIEDPFFAAEGDLAAARNFVLSTGRDLAQLFTYPGAEHLFTDSSLPSYDHAAYRQVMQRIREFLRVLEQATPAEA
ncbi:dienelactone hydrolase family protein [Glutamicibacter uratoxydans]|uniref:dienelactone hydrolase family protein n=1 Tax=Glutamicibacter uratoxydans TaxID=43667 RepID=UPI003D6E2155